jgi:DNA-binding CsgD family transcriptional regulator
MGYALRYKNLSIRGAEVLVLTCTVYSTNDIGEKLGISAHTVSNHRASVMLKTGSKNIIVLIAFAMHYGYLD